MGKITKEEVTEKVNLFVAAWEAIKSFFASFKKK